MRKLFATTEEAVRELMQDHTLRQISSYQRQIAELERKYGMSFAKFTRYLHERGAVLQFKELSPEQRQSLGRALMAEEDDWLDWKVATEMLQSWLEKSLNPPIDTRNQKASPIIWSWQVGA